MKLAFFKFHGAGNDFILIDNRDLQFTKDNTKLVKTLCDRRFGIGADGLMLLQNDTDSDFEMIYYNSDGNEGSMCGNGGRCIVAFAKMLGIIDNSAVFKASDGVHTATILNIFSSEHYRIKLKMGDVKAIETYDDYWFVDTGSPHYVSFRKNIDAINVKKEGRKIRYGKPFGTIGTNVNFVEIKDNAIYMRTYERGVEDETLSCGTGSVASALVAVFSESVKNTGFLDVFAKGGNLKVYFTFEKNIFKNVFLEGDAICVFNGIVDN